MSYAEAEASAWIVGRTSVSEAEIAAAYPALDAAALVARLREAGVLAA